MTGKDFELIADVIAQLERVQEQHYPNGELPAYATAGYVEQLFEEKFRELYPRFDAGAFEHRARPIWAAFMREHILEQLKRDALNA